MEYLEACPSRRDPSKDHTELYLDNDHNNSATATFSLIFTIKKDGPKDALEATVSEIKSLNVVFIK
ncbi:hypothetical protein ACFLKB_17715 (plasmid) [Clostridium sp. FAM 1755]|uniref:hypothetical protein n=1 Tax=Clostridium caseinilyticum TaxID=3350403 RepID=UPI0038F67DEF